MKMTRRTVRGRVQLEEIFNNNKKWWTQTPLPDDQTHEQDWWNQRPVPSREAVEQEWSAQAPTPADLSEAQEWSVQPSPPMQLMNTPCHSRERPESNVPDRLKAPVSHRGIPHWASTESELGSVESLECQ